MAAHTFHQLYYHFVWSTKERKPLLTGEKLPWLLRFLYLDARGKGATVLAHNAMPEHVHLFVTLPPTIAPATFIGQVKGAAAYAFNKQFPAEEPLVWQEGYGVITVRKAETDKVAAYVENQQDIHANRKPSLLLETTGEETQN